MNDIQLSKLLGWFSLGLGSVELLASRRIAGILGLGSSTLVQAFGARVVAAGFMVLNKPDTAMPVWGRVAGDAMDAAVLAMGLGPENRQRSAVAGALLFVPGGGRSGHRGRNITEQTRAGRTANGPANAREADRHGPGMTIGQPEFTDAPDQTTWRATNHQRSPEKYNDVLDHHRRQRRFVFPTYSRC